MPRRPAPRPDDPPRWVEHAIRFTFGAVVGFFLGAIFVPIVGWQHWPIVLGVAAVVAVVFGLLAVRYGDEFWEHLRSWWW
jgi:hypothetical protein